LRSKILVTLVAFAGSLSAFRWVAVAAGAPATIITWAGTPQSTAINSQFPVALVAAVYDSAGHGAQGATVTFSAPAGNAAGATFNGSPTATAIADATGAAIAPALTANGFGGNFTVTATVAGLSGSAIFSMTNTGGTTSGGGAPQSPVGLRFLVAGGSSSGPGPGTWTNVTPSGMSTTGSCYGANAVVADPSHQGTLYAHSCEGVWKSTNYGQTWTGPIDGGRMTGELAAGPNALYQGGISGSGMGFWRSTNGGVTWTNYRIAGLTSDRQDVYPPAVDPSDGNHLIICGHEQDFVGESVDGGQNWSTIPMAAGMHQAGGTGFVFFINTGDPTTTRKTWIWSAQGSGGAVGTWRTTNGGALWTKVDNNEHPHGNMQIFQPDKSGVVFMGGIYSASGWGVLRSTDYGATWTHVGASVSSGTVFGTPDTVFSFYGCGSGCGDSYQVAALPGVSGWISATAPPGIGGGANMAATVFDGTSWIIVTSNWQAGIWRWVP